MRKKLVASIVAIVAVCGVFAGVASAHSGSISYNCGILTYSFGSFASGNQAATVKYRLDGGAYTSQVVTWTGSSATKTQTVNVPNDGKTHDLEANASWTSQQTSDHDSGSFSGDFEVVRCPSDGQPGPAGPQGPQGPAGPSGPAGPAGPSGPAGPAGPAGPKGDTGAPGQNGQDGESCFYYTYDDEQSEQSTKHVDPLCVGPQGPKGDPGQNGSNGSTGATGAPGKDGAPGAPGKDADLCGNWDGVQSSAPAGTVATLNPRGQFVCVKLATAKAWHKAKKPVTITKIVRITKTIKVKSPSNAAAPRTAPYTR